MDRAVLREDMVEGLHHETKDLIQTDAVGLSMRTVPRHEFVPDERRAYADCASERFGSRVLAPSTVAQLIEALGPRPDDSVLVVGSGVGYTAAVIAEIVGAQNVQALDIARRLVIDSRRNLRAAGYDGVLVDHRDGTDGLAAYAPYDRILVEAAALEPPNALLDQLTDDGVLVIPQGAQTQTLTSIIAGGEICEEFGRVAFAPMLIDGEQPETLERNRTLREDREFAARGRAKRGWEHDWIDWESKR